MVFSTNITLNQRWHVKIIGICYSKLRFTVNIRYVFHVHLRTLNIYSRGQVYK